MAQSLQNLLITDNRRTGILYAIGQTVRKAHPFTEEFSGCIKAGNYVRRMLQPIRFIGDHSITATLNAYMQQLQARDTENKKGERRITLKADTHILEGFNLNQQTPFDSIVQSPVQYAFSKNTLTALVDIPALQPGNNFNPKGLPSYYRFIASLGIVPDLYHCGQLYCPKGNYSHQGVEFAETEWQLTQSGSPAMQLRLQWPAQPANNNYSVLIGIGIAFGNFRHNEPRTIRHMGGAKILAII
jgi:hypothetical protein